MPLLNVKFDLDTLLSCLEAQQCPFSAVLDTINTLYNFTPTAFNNGPIFNLADQNQGSCRVFAFAMLQQLNTSQTLKLFAEHYQLVLATPKNNDHANIRQFIQTGFSGLSFEQFPLTQK